MKPPIFFLLLLCISFSQSTSAQKRGGIRSSNSTKIELPKIISDYNPGSYTSPAYTSPKLDILYPEISLEAPKIFDVEAFFEEEGYKEKAKILDLKKANNLSAADKEEIDAKIKALSQLYTEYQDLSMRLGEYGDVVLKEPRKTSDGVFFNGGKMQTLVLKNGLALYKTERGLNGGSLKAGLVQDIQWRREELNNLEEALSVLSGDGTLVTFKKQENSLSWTDVYDSKTKQLIRDKMDLLRKEAWNYLSLNEKLGGDPVVAKPNLLTVLDLKKFIQEFSELQGRSDQYFSRDFRRELEKISSLMKSLHAAYVGRVRLLGYANTSTLQEQKNLNVSGKLDPETRTLIDQEVTELTEMLADIGIKEKYFEAQVENYKKITKSEEYKIQLLQDYQKRVLYTAGGKKLNRLHLEIDATLQMDFIQLENERILLHPESSSKTTLDQRLKEVNENLDRKLPKGEIEILSLVRDKSTSQLLEKEFPEHTIKYAVKKSANLERLEKVLSKSKGKTIFVVGHMEGNEFVSYHKGKAVFKLSLGELEKMGKAYDLNLFPFACNSALATDGKYGTTTKLNSISDTKQLIVAIKNNHSIRGVLNEFCGADKTIIVDQFSFKDKGFAKYKFYKQTKKGGTAALITTGIVTMAFEWIGGGGEEEEEEEKEKTKENQEE